jgi:hypothetical protein
MGDIIAQISLQVKITGCVKILYTLLNSMEKPNSAKPKILDKFAVLWRTLNDEGLLPPKGKNILPNFTDLTDSLKVRNSVYSAVMILNTLIMTSSNAESKEVNFTGNSKQIEWTLEALEGIDPIDYLLEKSATNASIEDTKVFDDYERSLLAWNLYHEARGELSNKKENKGLEGILGQLFSVFERMKSKSFPAEPEETVFDKSQYSWTPNLLKEEGIKDDKQKIQSYTELREIVEKITVGNFGESYKTLKRILLDLSERKELPESLTDYHVFGMLDSADTKKRDRYLKDIRSEDTYKRILVIDQMLIDKDPNVVMFGSLHVYYSQKLFTSDYVNKKFADFRTKGLPEFTKEIPELPVKSKK